MWLVSLGFWFNIAFGIEVFTTDIEGYQVMFFFGPFVFSFAYQVTEVEE